MRHDDLYLVDVIESAARVRRMLGKTSVEGFRQDEMVASAVQYHLIVVGEACGKLQPETLARFESLPIQAVRAFRNRLVHGYFSVNLDVVYEVAAVHLPALASHAESALGELYPETYQKMRARREAGLL
jgi:uncharacterized protein with HEPN domain